MQKEGMQTKVTFVSGSVTLLVSWGAGNMRSLIWLGVMAVLYGSGGTCKR
jgi:hypothetical protein